MRSLKLKNRWTSRLFIEQTNTTESSKIRSATAEALTKTFSIKKMMIFLFHQVEYQRHLIKRVLQVKRKKMIFKLKKLMNEIK